MNAFNKYGGSSWFAMRFLKKKYSIKENPEPRAKILDEILAIRKARMLAGNYSEILELTDAQHEALKEWCDSTRTVCRAPDGSVRIQDGLRYENGMIAGMRYTPKGVVAPRMETRIEIGPQPGEWQPIETAPVDAEIIVLFDSATVPVVRLCEWQDYDIDTREESGWWSYRNSVAQELIDLPAVAWMPMPKPKEPRG